MTRSACNAPACSADARLFLLHRRTAPSSRPIASLRRLRCLPPASRGTTRTRLRPPPSTLRPSLVSGARLPRRAGMRAPRRSRRPSISPPAASTSLPRTRRAEFPRRLNLRGGFGRVQRCRVLSAQSCAVCVRSCSNSHAALRRRLPAPKTGAVRPAKGLHHRPGWPYSPSAAWRRDGRPARLRRPSGTAFPHRSPSVSRAAFCTSSRWRPAALPSWRLCRPSAAPTRGTPRQPRLRPRRWC